MPISNPTPNAVHVNRPLSNISIAYTQSADQFVSDRVFPLISVAKQSDSYFTYDRSYWFRSEVQQRAPGTESAGSDYKVATENYNCDVFALHKDIADQVRGNEDNPLNSDRDATEWLTLQFMIKKEKSFAANYMATSLWTFEADGVASSPTAAGSFDPTSGSDNKKLQWNDASSTPVEDIRQAKRNVLRQTGMRANTLTLGQDAYDALVDHPDILDRIKYGQTAGAPAMSGVDTLAKLFEVDKVLVSGAVENSAAEGATESNGFIVGKHALLTYSAPRPSILLPSAGYTFSWNGYIGGSDGAAQISKFRMDALKSDRVEGEAAYDQKLVAADCGYFFEGIVA